jgi:hypothetical protein
MLPRGTLASAPHARTAHGRSAVRARSLSEIPTTFCRVGVGLRQKSADRYTPGPAIVHAIALSGLPAIRRICRARRVHMHVCRAGWARRFAPVRRRTNIILNTRLSVCDRT